MLLTRNKERDEAGGLVVCVPVVQLLGSQLEFYWTVLYAHLKLSLTFSLLHKGERYPSLLCMDYGLISDDCHY